jgi:hypothetical protein
VSGETPTVKFVTALVADDIRREASGKEIIIGTYTSQIIVAAINPNGGMIIAISLIFETHGVGDIPIQLRVIPPSGETFAIMNGTLHSQEITVPGQINTASLAGIPLPISAEGDVLIQARQYAEEWQTIRVLPVILNPNAPGLSAGVPSASSIALEPPSSLQPPVLLETSSSPEPSLPARPTRRRRS